MNEENTPVAEETLAEYGMPSIGDDVMYVIAEGVYRPMKVVNVDRRGGAINGVYFRDGSNDDAIDTSAIGMTQGWATGCPHDQVNKQVGSWFYPQPQAYDVDVAEEVTETAEVSVEQPVEPNEAAGETEAVEAQAEASAA